MPQMPHSATGVGGNTKSQPPAKSRKYCLTLNNYSILEYENLIATCHTKKFKYIIGKEIGESGTPHLQIFISKDNTIRFDTLKNINKRFHIEASKGDEIDNIGYCSKDGDYITNYKDDYVKECIEEYYKRKSIIGYKKKIKEPDMNIVGNYFNFDIRNCEDDYNHFIEHVDPNLEGYNWLKNYLKNHKDDGNYLKFRL
nr:MAG: replication associated protein [Cressdnaviricota sp.]